MGDTVLSIPDSEGVLHEYRVTLLRDLPPAFRLDRIDNGKRRLVRSRWQAGEELDWSCTCEAHRLGGQRFCKHIDAVTLFYEERMNETQETGTSTSTDRVVKALVAAFAEMQHPAKDRQNTHLKNWYASLDSILTTLRPILAKHGLAVIQWPSSGAIGPVLHTRILHASGQHLDFDPLGIPSAKQDAQGWGSAITYARRYVLLALCGVTAGDDDDGAAASHEQAAPAPVRTAPRTLTPDHLATLRERCSVAAQYGLTEAKIATVYKVARIDQIPDSKYDEVLTRIQRWLEAKLQPANLDADEVDI